MSNQEVIEYTTRLVPSKQTDQRREYMRQYAITKTALGKCTNCQNPPIPGLKVCEVCRDYRNKRRDECRAQGLCFRHKEPILPGRKDRCAKCVESRLLKIFKITATDYQNRLQQQNNACPICKTVFTETPVIDHDHACCDTTNTKPNTCGKCVRGVLCDKCNWGIGSFNDNVEKLQAAIDYLNQWKARGN